jgi:hypothetical protein
LPSSPPATSGATWRCPPSRWRSTYKGCPCC